MIIVVMAYQYIFVVVIDSHDVITLCLGLHIIIVFAELFFIVTV